MQKIISQILDLATKKGMELAEVFLMNAQHLTIEVADQEVNNLKLAEERGLGVRVISGQRLGYAYSSDLTEQALVKTVDRAIYNSRATVVDPVWQMAGRQKEYPTLDLYDEEILQKTVEEKISLALEVEKAALSSDSRVKRVERAGYEDSCYQVWIANTRGLEADYRGSYCGLYGIAIGSQEGEAETGFGMDFTLKYRDLKPLKVGQEATEKAVRMLGAQSMTTAKIPVVLDPYIMTGLLGVLQTAFSGEAVLKGKSFLAELEGKQVASAQVNLIDHGALHGRLGSAPFDGEGIPTKETILLKEGELQGFLHNHYTARKSGVTSTGNAQRNSYKATPEVGTTNLYLDKGTVSRQELLAEITSGLYVTEVMGLHTANPISGDFSLGASGLLIEQGKLTKPIKGVAIAGNLQDLLLGIDAVADDLTFYAEKGAPTVRIQGITISGK